jgi:hypothetical protein
VGQTQKVKLKCEFAKFAFYNAIYANIFYSKINKIGILDEFGIKNTPLSILKYLCVIHP